MGFHLDAGGDEHAGVVGAASKWGPFDAPLRCWSSIEGGIDANFLPRTPLNPEPSALHRVYVYIYSGLGLGFHLDAGGDERRSGRSGGYLDSFSPPLSNELGTHNTVKARFWSWLPGKNSLVVSCYDSQGPTSLDSGERRRQR